MFLLKHVCFNMNASYDDMQKTVYVPRCLRGLWDGPKDFEILAAILDANVTIQEFDTAWKKRTSALTTKRAKMQLVRLLKDAGVGGGGGGARKVRRQQKVWFVNEVVGRGTGAPAPAMSPNNTRTQVCLYVCL